MFILEQAATMQYFGLSSRGFICVKPKGCDSAGLGARNMASLGTDNVLMNRISTQVVSNKLFQRPLKKETPFNALV